ncbi:ZYRO0A01078p [Zygosaccharomyces rouxii]|uniref:ZYRO0A01078p n=1 Tax=Zygosaccharomyces rouxii (strain ATCC 2623 / CBS 732 / NBRC 1130 / NCYC 568 / NRRL Y-229) TaxID=559307 RepID=C5DP76_ZYGRC|nr:uncharacterized protein ZYRO0A01078g [Zygosaccharomyces rouxii]KAH9198993.1 ferric reductase like transmembrane component-domain-containing protein [Zygosaccharomyces rouxii]CAR25487.1 ZYRO0A01078p [Zygosaccharomyces rouxii]
MDMSNNPEYVKETNEVWNRNFARARYWGAGLMGYWGLLVLIASINNWSTRFYPRATLVLRSQLDRFSPIRWLRGHVLIPTLLPRGKHLMHNRIGGLIPTRFESLILFIYFALVFIGESVNYETSKHNIYWPQKKDQLTRYVGDRSAIISMFIIIPTYLFAGRNNFLLWLTGWRQSTFMTFHRWLARMAVVSSLVHTFTMLLNDYWLHTVHLRKYTQYWRWGSVAIICGVIMVVQSLPFLRRSWYEIFLYGHIILALFFLIGVCIHLTVLGYGQYAYAAASVWAFDRCIRLIRLGCFGIRYANVSITDEKHLLVIIDDSAQVWDKKPKPGAFGYLYFLTGPFSWFQSHPFSVITIENSNSIAFQVTVKNGLTKRLYNDLISKADQTSRMKIMLEGFYGEYKPVRGYDQVMMFSSGAGAISPLEYLKEVVDHNSNTNSNQEHHNVKYVKFYWMVPDLSYTRVLAPELIKLQKLEYVHPIIYVTQPQSKFQSIGSVPSGDENSSSSVNQAAEDLEKSKGDKTKDTSITVNSTEEAIPISSKLESELVNSCEIHYGSRPDLNQLLIQDLQETQPSDHVAVMTCAHPAVCDQIRSIVAEETSIKKGRSGTLDLIELLQSW